MLADEPLRVAGVRRGEGVGAGCPHRLCVSIVDVVGGVPGDARMAMFLVVPAVERLTCARAASILVNRSGKSGRYFNVLNWASEKGLSLEIRGRE
jgi:hypothetical protein